MFTPEQWANFGWSIAGWIAVVALPPLFVFGLKWLSAQASMTVTDKRSATLKLLAQLAVTGVTMAEQTLTANPTKKQAVLSFVQAYLTAHGIKLPLEEIDAAIESAVFTETAHGVLPMPPAA